MAATPLRKRNWLAIALVVALMAFIAVAIHFAGPRFFRSEEVEGREAMIWMRNLAVRIEMYRRDVGSYPASLHDLVVRPEKADRWSGPYARQAELLDLWGTPYGYTVPGTQGRNYDLVSFGPDRKPGGEGRDRDRVLGSPAHSPLK
jgi:general secretion pathway protein G